MLVYNVLKFAENLPEEFFQKFNLIKISINE